ncbi:hypothetical protein HANVADRAFT_49189 [Hanseniaspora valbyensis NRRL Y-1626]|uniref:Phospholipase D/nuclease n=1 Tax=Hanseniaspora valbyensis NRRL Y-1626 TaxID=766949 RepID=A0A1B7TCH2_9ASCO|nr:hypothetical protein HANVADRAFT_49189 [Hanseniaspora valbyensis NRRL Y-1626]
MLTKKREYVEITLSSDSESNSDLEIVRENITQTSSINTVKKQKTASTRGTPYPQFKLSSSNIGSDFTLLPDELLRPMSITDNTNEVHLMASYDTCPFLIKEQLERYPNINIILLATMPENYETHKRLEIIKLEVKNDGWADMYHSKYLIKQNDNNLEIYIGTGNFNPLEFEVVQNIWFYSGRLRRLEREPKTNKTNNFLKNLERMFGLLSKRMNSNGAKKNLKFVSTFKQFDFENLRNYNIIIHHFDMAMNDILKGHNTDLEISKEDNLHLTVQCSSIGRWVSIPNKILKFFSEIVFKTKNVKTMFNIIFPSITEVIKTGNINVAPYFHSPVFNEKIKENVRGISEVLGYKNNFNDPSHSKSYMLRQKNKILWYYMTSANLSMTSWSNGSYYRKVKTHELGVSVLARKDLEINYVNIAEAIVENKRFNEYDTVGKTGKIDVFGLINEKFDFTKKQPEYENFDFRICSGI